MKSDSELETALRSLPTLDARPSKAQTVARLARAELSRQTRQHPLVRRLNTVWNGVLEPALVVAVMVVYSAWGLGLVNRLFTAQG